MERTEFRIILNTDQIPNEGMGSIEWVPGLGVVSYLDIEERIKQCQTPGPFLCPITNEMGTIDLDWKGQYEEHKDDPVIVPLSTEIYVVKDSSIIAKFYGYDSEGICYNKRKAVEYAEQFVKALEQRFKKCPNCDGKNEEVNECCRYCGWTF